MDLSVVNWLSDWSTDFLSVRYFKVWRDHSIIQLTGFHCFIFFFFPLVSDIAFWMSVCGAGLLGRSIRPTVRAHHHPRSGHVLWNIIQGCDICNSRLCICDLGLPRYCRSHITGLDAFKLGSHPTFFMNTIVVFFYQTHNLGLCQLFSTVSCDLRAGHNWLVSLLLWKSRCITRGEVEGPATQKALAMVRNKGVAGGEQKRTR